MKVYATQMIHDDSHHQAFAAREVTSDALAAHKGAACSQAQNAGEVLVKIFEI